MTGASSEDIRVFHHQYIVEKSLAGGTLTNVTVKTSGLPTSLTGVRGVMLMLAST